MSFHREHRPAFENLLPLEDLELYGRHPVYLATTRIVRLFLRNSLVADKGNQKVIYNLPVHPQTSQGVSSAARCADLHGSSSRFPYVRG